MTESKQDTITVELPIKTRADGRVSVCSLRYTREYWREVAASPDQDLTSILAPAVVAWIERDEWEPLGVPETGRTIKATLRDGREFTDVVRSTATRAGYYNIELGSVLYFIDADIQGAIDDPRTIVAWEYVDEPDVDLAAIVDKITAAVNELREAIAAVKGDTNG